MSSARVRLGVVSWNSADLLGPCLTSLPAALGALPYDVVVVDNASSDQSREVAAQHGARVIANATNVGYARAMNQALEPSDAEVLIALNPDTLAPPGSLEALVHGLLADGSIAVISPQLRLPTGELQPTAYRFPGPAVTLGLCFVPRRIRDRFGLGQRWWLEGESSAARATSVDWCIGAVHVLRRAAMDSPPYRERWFMYVEDLDLCWRARRAGWRVVIDGAVEVSHVGNASGAAWGHRRQARWLTATYDWYEESHGWLRTRGWAAANVAGALAVLLRSWLVDRASGAPLRSDLRRALRVHRGALIRTPQPLAGPPPAGGEPAR